MKKKPLLFCFLLAAAATLAAQPTAHFGHNNIYMYWPTPCLECPLYLGKTYCDPPSDMHPIFSQAFQYNHEEANIPCTVYGVAADVVPEAGHDAYTFQGSTWRVDGAIDVFLYKATVGDSSVELMKTSHHAIHAGKVPDRVLVIRDSLAERLPKVEQYLHEFYFDEPVTVSGPFLVGMMSDIPLEFSFFHGTDLQDKLYYPLVWLDMKEQKIVRHWRGDWVTGSFLDVDSVSLKFEAQSFYPILVPRGSAVGTDQVQEAGGLRIAPNPARTEVRVEAGCTVREVVVTDMVGRSVLHRDCHDGEQSVTLDVSRLPKGCYAVRVGTDRGVLTEKLSVQQ